MPRLEFWYDFSSPWTYLASTQVEAVAERSGAELVWKPMLLGAVFKQVGTANVPLMAMADAKRRYIARDLYMWAAHWQVPFRFASRFPMRTVTALRLALLADDRMVELSHAFFRALWVDDRDLNDEATLHQLLLERDFDADTMLAQTQTEEVKQRLIDNTDAAVAAGVFGAPTFIVKDPRGDQLFWGQDRFDFIERAVAGWRM